VVAPLKNEGDELRDQYEQMRKRILAQDPAGAASERLVQRGMRSWIESGGQVPAPPSVEPQKTDTDWKPIVPMIAGLMLRLAEKEHPWSN
jgi:hypothetical protein